MTLSTRENKIKTSVFLKNCGNVNVQRLAYALQIALFIWLSGGGLFQAKD